MKSNKPSMPIRILRWFCHPDLIEDVEGDLNELYEEKQTETSKMKAKWVLWLEIIKLFRSDIVKPIEGTNRLNHFGMFKNNLKIGWRNVVKYKSYSAINVFGLSLGIASAFLLLMIINYENSFDQIHDHAENIYRIGDRDKSSKYISDVIPTPTLPALLAEYPEIVGGTRFMNLEDMVQYGEKYFRSSYHIVDSGFVKTFSFEVLDGDLDYTLSNANNLAITKSIAEKIFGDQDPIGKELSFVNEGKRFTVGAILEDPPKNSTRQFEILIPWLNAPNWLDIDQAGNWYNTFMVTFIRLQDGSDKVEFEEKLISFKEKYYIEKRHDVADIALLPLLGEHHRETENDRSLAVFTIIAIVILVISCINFMNLSTTQFMGRAKEIGIRKVMGSAKPQLIFQFLTETSLISTTAIMSGLVMIYFATPFVDNYFELDIATISFYDINFMTILLIVGGFTGILSGVYPALVIARSKVVDSLKGKVGSLKSGKYLQQTLISVQFCCSILLVSGALIIWKQIDFMKTKDLNFDANNTIGINNNADLFKDSQNARGRLKVLKNELKNEPSIVSVATAESFPGQYWQNYNNFEPNVSEDLEEIHLRQISVDDGYFETLKIKMILGRNFYSHPKKDSAAAIINQTAFKKLGWTDLENKYLLAGGDENEKHKVVGVVEDYYYQSLQSGIQPVIHYYSDYVNNKMIVRFHPGHLETGVDLLKSKWEELESFEPLEYSFIDAEFDKLYKSYERMGATTTIFSVIAIIIASLGLFSIASFTIRTRRKEVGIRKVLGATIQNIILLLSKRFSYLILIAFLISCPIAYYLSDMFLSDFVNKTKFEIWILLVAGLCAFAMAAISISLESIKTALSNPVDSLRDE